MSTFTLVKRSGHHFLMFLTTAIVTLLTEWHNEESIDIIFYDNNRIMQLAPHNVHPTMVQEMRISHIEADSLQADDWNRLMHMAYGNIIVFVKVPFGLIQANLDITELFKLILNRKTFLINLETLQYIDPLPEELLTMTGICLVSWTVEDVVSEIDGPVTFYYKISVPALDGVVSGYASIADMENINGCENNFDTIKLQFKQVLIIKRLTNKIMHSLNGNIFLFDFSNKLKILIILIFILINSYYIYLLPLQFRLLPNLCQRLAFYYHILTKQYWNGLATQVLTSINLVRTMSISLIVIKVYNYFGDVNHEMHALNGNIKTLDDLRLLFDECKARRIRPSSFGHESYAGAYTVKYAQFLELLNDYNKNFKDNLKMISMSRFGEYEADFVFKPAANDKPITVYIYSKTKEQFVIEPIHPMCELLRPSRPAITPEVTGSEVMTTGETTEDKEKEKNKREKLPERFVPELLPSPKPPHKEEKPQITENVKEKIEEEVPEPKSYDDMILPLFNDIRDGIMPSLSYLTTPDDMTFDPAKMHTRSTVFTFSFILKLSLSLFLINGLFSWYRWTPRLTILALANMCYPNSNINLYLFISMAGSFSFLCYSLYNSFIYTEGEVSYYKLCKISNISTTNCISRDRSSLITQQTHYQLKSYKNEGHYYRATVLNCAVSETLINEILSQAIAFSNVESIQAFVSTRLASLSTRIKNLVHDSTAYDLGVLQSAQVICTSILAKNLLQTRRQGFVRGSSE